MTFHRTILSRFRAVACVVLLCALAGRVVVPTGYMIGVGGKNGLPVIEMCTGHGAVTVLASGQPTGPHDDHKAADHPCAFAAASAAVDVAKLLYAAAPMLAVVAVPTPSLGFARPGLGLAAPPPPQTGPPAIR